MLQLSKRLSTVAGYVLPDGVLADIGTDHALLPTYLVQAGVIPRAIAGDIHAGPVMAAQRQVEAAGLSHAIAVRMGNGLEVLSAGEADTISIAGMGGGTMVDILSGGGNALKGVRRLVLQPNIGERIVREWLIAEGWRLTHEVLLEEEGLMYEVLVADIANREEAERWNASLYRMSIPGLQDLSPSVLQLMGPYLIQEHSPLFVRKWQAYVEKLDDVIEQIGKSNQPEAIRKQEAFRKERQEVSEVLQWLSK